jgi:hypothetical protein
MSDIRIPIAPFGHQSSLLAGWRIVSLCDRVSLDVDCSVSAEDAGPRTITVVFASRIGASGRVDLVFY